MSGVCKCPVAHSRAIVPEREIVIGLSPAKLLRASSNTVLFCLCFSTGLSDLVKCLVFAVFCEVIFLVFHLEDLAKAESILLLCSLVCQFRCYYFVFLEVVPVRVLALE